MSASAFKASSALLKQDLGKLHINLRSKEGVLELFGMMEAKRRKVQGKKVTAKIQSACSHMAKIQDVVGAGASAGGPYVVIVTEALFSVFAMNETYAAEKALMFGVAVIISDFVVMFPDDGHLTTITADDSPAMRAVKEKLRIVLVALHKAVYLATAQMVLYSNGDFKWLKGVVKHYDWEGQLAELHKQEQRIAGFEATKKRLEEKDKSGKPETLQTNLQLLIGPAERNSLHWAAALGDAQQVTFFVQSK
ncbi:hypothetical protein E8E12_008304 [Didymella heteroderae]|uniref:Uncharacterized protein n=1 Tax=Didymella heteroderae TaxID=1769908 RepID=A0A9P5C3G9_9PLEO|nr:hypothetical protein E8E12_008304 [Didymella heteroderae]